MYTFKQAAELANLHENTARNYRDRFPDYFSWTGEGRRRRYSEETVPLLIFIAEKVAQNMTQEQIQTELEKRFGVFINTITPEDDNTPLKDNNITPTQDNSNTITRTQFAELVKLAVAEELRQHDERIEKKFDLLNESLSNGNRALIDELQALKQDQQKIEKEKKTRDAEVLQANESSRKEIAALHDSIKEIEKRQEERELVHFDLVDKRLNQLTPESKKGFWARLFNK